MRAMGLTPLVAWVTPCNRVVLVSWGAWVGLNPWVCVTPTPAWAAWTPITATPMTLKPCFLVNWGQLQVRSWWDKTLQNIPLWRMPKRPHLQFPSSPYFLMFFYHDYTLYILYFQVILAKSWRISLLSWTKRNSRNVKKNSSSSSSKIRHWTKNLQCDEQPFFPLIRVHDKNNTNISPEKGTC